MNCPNCGAAIKEEGRFCNYCGAKLPDDTKRVEVKIDKRIEDVAEVKRASYEEKESILRQKQMKRDLRRGKVKWITCGCLMLFGVICGVFNWSPLLAFAILIGVPIFIIFDWLHKM